MDPNEKTTENIGESMHMEDQRPVSPGLAEDQQDAGSVEEFTEEQEMDNERTRHFDD